MTDLPQGAGNAPDNLSSTPSTNGHAASPTVEALAEHKKLPADFLREMGLTDLRGGVGIRYADFGNKDICIKRRTALKAKEGSFWPKGQPLRSYGDWRIKAAADRGFLFVAEGETDTLTLWFHGLPTIGLPGAGAGRYEIAGNDPSLYNLPLLPIANRSPRSREGEASSPTPGEVQTGCYAPSCAAHHHVPRVIPVSLADRFPGFPLEM